MLSHKNNCNYFLYEKYSRETTFLNTILNSLMCDLSREITDIVYEENIVKDGEK